MGYHHISITAAAAAQEGRAKLIITDRDCGIDGGNRSGSVTETETETPEQGLRPPSARLTQFRPCLSQPGPAHP